MNATTSEMSRPSGRLSSFPGTRRHVPVIGRFAGEAPLRAAMEKVDELEDILAAELERLGAERVTLTVNAGVPDITLWDVISNLGYCYVSVEGLSVTGDLFERADDGGLQRVPEVEAVLFSCLIAAVLLGGEVLAVFPGGNGGLDTLSWVAGDGTFVVPDGAPQPGNSNVGEHRMQPLRPRHWR